MTLSENYKYILTEEKDTFGELQRAKISLEESLTKSKETRDSIKKKRDRVLQWMQQDTASRNDDDLVYWLKQVIYSCPCQRCFLHSNESSSNTTFCVTAL